jgi:hypothetical protein
VLVIVSSKKNFACFLVSGSGVYLTILLLVVIVLQCQAWLHFLQFFASLDVHGCEKTVDIAPVIELHLHHFVLAAFILEPHLLALQTAVCSSTVQRMKIKAKTFYLAAETLTINEHS